MSAGFQSTLSSRRATGAAVNVIKETGNFNPRSPHGERRNHIHDHRRRPDFNPRSPHGERRRIMASLEVSSQFQSTLSSRRATGNYLISSLFSRYFNPRSPHGERPGESTPCVMEGVISIHALLTESDDIGDIPSNISRVFQSTLSSRRATDVIQFIPPNRLISIHALLTESDGRCPVSYGGKGISIHALLTESDGIQYPELPGALYFNPRSPHGERQQIPPNWPYRFCLKCQF